MSNAAHSEAGRTARSLPALVHESGAEEAWIPFVDVIAIGREQGDVRIPDDPYLSHRHVRIERLADHFVLRDCGSTNGTFVQVTPNIELRPGDEILIGGQLFRLVL